MKKGFSQERLEAARIIGILRGFTYVEIRRFLPAYIKAGLATLEITMNSPEPVETIQRLVAEFGDSLNIGAGTVCELHQFDAAVSAGAQFIVTPNTDEQIIDRAVSKGVPIIPGAFTATEIYRAAKSGAMAVKLFPATAITPGYVNDIRGPFPQVKMVPTGGVTLDNSAAFMAAGSYAVGIGGQLFNKAIMHAGSEEALYRHFRQFYDSVQSRSNNNQKP